MSGQTNFDFMDPPDGHAERAADGVPPVRDGDRRLAGWLGLATSHRRLFDAGQDGWLRPPAGSGFLLGRESFVSEEPSAGRNAIPVRLAFDIDKLPFPDARKELERAAAEGDDDDESGVVRWRAPIPLYATTTVEVPSDEQKTHLLAMAGQFSNLSLPDAPVVVTGFAPEPPPTGGPGTPETRPLELPEALNAAQGAMAMAVWAVPHVEPWIEVLRHALDGDAADVAGGMARLHAPWLRIPWLDGDPPGPARDDADGRARLWRAALACMAWSTAGEESPAALAERIARAACLDGENRNAETWLDRTRRIVAAEEPIARDNWRNDDTGLAVLLALLRPDPMTFRSWNMDLAGVPPGVWWAAATLCGWRRGYRDLDREFRGDAPLQEFVATRALAATWPGAEETALPPPQRPRLERAHEDGCYTLTWRGHPVVRKEWKSRAKWYAADLADLSGARAARDLAVRLEWPCIERRLALPQGRLPTVGGGQLAVDGDALVVEGDKSLRLPEGVNIEARVATEEFLRLLATQAGDLPDPPDDIRRRSATGNVVVADPPELSVIQPERLPPGLIYRPDFITEEEETELRQCIDNAEWSQVLRRRVQHYGWRYDYKNKRIDESMRLGDLPEWARDLSQKLVDGGLMKDPPDQLIVNEYCGKQGIAAHVDHPTDFTEHVATVSLLQTWGMVFRHLDRKTKVEKALERRSVAVLTGDARYKWKHEIPRRVNSSEMDEKGKPIKRTRRISLTFRRTRMGRDT